VRPKVLNARDLPRHGRQPQLPPGAKLVDRRTPWGNPYRIGQPTIDVAHPLQPPHPMTRAESVEMYRAELGLRLLADPEYLAPLRGATALVCWCAPDACHADALADALEQEDTRGRTPTEAD
jgi:hypothetical protein